MLFGLEDRLISPGEQPGVIVFYTDTLTIGGKERCDSCTRESLPRVALRAVDLAILAFTGTRVCTANGEDTAVAKCGARLVTASNKQIWGSGEGVGSWVVEA